jgi:hypothetical protein
VAHQVANLPPVGSLFAAFLGYNPVAELMGRRVHFSFQESTLLC